MKKETDTFETVSGCQRRWGLGKFWNDASEEKTTTEEKETQWKQPSEHCFVEGRGTESFWNATVSPEPT